MEYVHTIQQHKPNGRRSWALPRMYTEHDARSTRACIRRMVIAVSHGPDGNSTNSRGYNIAGRSAHLQSLGVLVSQRDEEEVRAAHHWHKVLLAGTRHGADQRYSFH